MPTRTSTARLTLVDPTTSAAWRNLIDASTDSSLFHTPDWIRVVQETYDIPAMACILEEDGRPTGGAVWSQPSDFMGERRISLGFSDYADILSPDLDRSRRIADHVVADGHRWVLRSRARLMPEVSAPLASTTQFKLHRIDLSVPESEMWGRLTSMAQRGVKKAERSGVECIIASDPAQLQAWRLLHLRLRKYKHHLLAQPYRFFENIWRVFIEPGRGFLLLAMFEGKIAGGTLYIIDRDVCYYKFNASDTDALSVRPNNLLMWRGMVEAKARGCRVLDLGRSNAKQEGLVAFKRGFGASEEDVYANVYATQPESDREREGREMLQSLTHQFIDPSLPDAITDIAGNSLYRYFM